MRKLMGIFLSAVLGWLLLESEAVQAAALEAMSMCLRSVIPALLPFLIVSQLLISLDFGQVLSPLFRPLMALYRLPGCAATALVLGLVGGYPVGARTAAQLYTNGQLTKPEAERLLTFCNNANPVFLLTVLGSGVFGSLRAGVWLWGIHLLSALVTGFLFRGPKIEKRQAVTREIPCQQIPFRAALTGALAHGSQACLSVCTCVLFFYVLLTPLRRLPGRLATVIIGLTELFSGVSRLAPEAASFPLAALFAGFGGLSVLAQSAAVLEGSGLSPLALLKGKAVQGLLSLLLVEALLLLSQSSFF